MEKQTLSDADLVRAIADYLRQELADADPIGARLKFSYGQGAAIVIDGTKRTCAVSSGDAQADCTVTLSLATHSAMLQFLLDQAVAFRQGELTISGDINVALRLAPRITKPFHPPEENA